jgi:hypothetical protein
MIFDILFAPQAPVIGNLPKDVYGAPIIVGSVVKFVGVVTAVNSNDTHYGDIQVNPLHPGSVLFIPDLQSGVFPQSPNFSPGNSQLPAQQFGFHPLQLIVGS